jgi:hypothetical protein
MPGNRCITRNPATLSRGFSTNRSNASRSLTCGVEKFQAAELHERDVATGQLELQGAAVRGRTEEHRLLLWSTAGSRQSFSCYLISGRN